MRDWNRIVHRHSSKNDGTVNQYRGIDRSKNALLQDSEGIAV